MDCLFQPLLTHHPHTTNHYCITNSETNIVLWIYHLFLRCFYTSTHIWIVERLMKEVGRLPAYRVKPPIKANGSHLLALGDVYEASRWRWRTSILVSMSLQTEGVWLWVILHLNQSTFFIYLPPSLVFCLQIHRVPLLSIKSPLTQFH